jgi:hypothetical protein
MGRLVLYILLLNIILVSVSTNESPKVESLWISVRIENHSTRNLLVNNPILKYGKFYCNGNTDQEGCAPNYVPVDKGYSKLVMQACGRAYTPSGTEGSIDIQDVVSQVKVARFNWDCPYWSDSNQYFVTELNDIKLLKFATRGGSYRGAIRHVTIIVTNK